MVRALAVRAAGRRHLSHEHTSPAASWRWPKVAGRFDHFVDFDVRAFRRRGLQEQGIELSPSKSFAERHQVCRKPTRPGCVRAPWLSALAKRCDGRHAHWQLVGPRATRAAEYDGVLCR
eukprot:9452633-Alexandrium_andersonii.AAC.1